MEKHIVPTQPPAADMARVTELFKALSEPLRLQVMLLLSRSEQTVSELVEAIGAPQSTVSRHLALLRAAKLVATERHGASVTYRLADTHLNGLLLEAFSHAQHERMGLPDHAEEKEKKVRL